MEKTMRNILHFISSKPNSYFVGSGVFMLVAIICYHLLNNRKSDGGKGKRSGKRPSPSKRSNMTESTTSPAKSTSKKSPTAKKTVVANDEQAPVGKVSTRSSTAAASTKGPLSSTSKSGTPATKDANKKTKKLATTTKSGDKTSTTTRSSTTKLATTTKQALRPSTSQDKAANSTKAAKNKDAEDGWTVVATKKKRVSSSGAVRKD